MANGMAGLYIGASGLQAAQAALNTTAHNLSNINTTGYTRQQITNETSQYYTIGMSATGTMQYGIGVNISEIRRVRDELIDKAYRQESGRLGYYASQYEALTEVESLFGEMQGVTYQSSLEGLKKSVEEIAKNPGSTVARASLIQSATAFIDRSNSIYNSLVSYQSTLNTQVKNMVAKINKLGQTIADLNIKIRDIELSGEKANDLRDLRDNALDELSGLIKIQYDENSNGVVTVNAEGVPFVNENGTYPMATQEIEGTGLLKPVWSFFDNRDVFIENEKITTMNNNDIGQLKGLLLARGSKTVNYKDVPVEPNADDYDMTDIAQKKAYDEAMKQYQKDCEVYNESIDPSIILSTMASLDKLVNGIVTSINDILCPETTTSFTAADGTVYDNVTVLDMSKTGYGNDIDKTVGQELFSRTYTERYKQVTGADGKTYYVRNDKNVIGEASEYTLGNISVNPIVSQDKGKIPLTTIIGEEDFDRGQELVDAWDKKFAALNPSKYAKEDFESFYNSLVSEFADVGSILGKLVDNQSTMAAGYDAQRKQTEGVSSDEELQNMIKFQQAYNAASRYVNVVSEMLEHLVTRLGS